MGTDILTGKIVKWIDKKGFGFIESTEDDKQLFVHISSFERNTGRKPRVGDTVSYHLSKDKSGRPCAIDATIAGMEAPKAPATPKKVNETNTDANEKHSKTVNYWFIAVAVATAILGALLYMNK